MSPNASRPNIVLLENPDGDNRKIISDALMVYNEKVAGPSGLLPLVISIQDPETGEKLGGLLGRTIYGWLVIELVAVPEQYRGQNIGTEIVKQAEAIARARGCKGAWVDTYAFQAPGFYEKLGFERFGEIEGHPPGSSRVYLKKEFA